MRTRETFISVNRNMRVDTAEITGRKIMPKSPPWSARKLTLHGGKQEGDEGVTVDNGKLSFTLVPTRGMSVLEAKLGDVRLGWNSPVKEVVHPHRMKLQSRGGLGWLEGVNERMVRCGLESNGAPGVDKFINNGGAEAAMELTWHGKIVNISASEVEVVLDHEAPYRIRMPGRLDERAMFGPKLELCTKISTESGSNELRITELITNRGASEQEFQVLCHANYGPPLLEDGDRFLAPAQRVAPSNGHAAKSVENYATYDGTTVGFVERVNCVHPLADTAGRTLIAVANKTRDRAVSRTCAVKELPCVTLWKNTASDGEGYVTGLEPGANFPNNRRIGGKLGRVPKLAPGASRSATIDYAIHIGAEQVSRVAGHISAIQGNQQPVIASQPEKMD